MAERNAIFVGLLAAACVVWGGYELSRGQGHAEAGSKLPFRTDFNAALAEAKNARKPLLVFFHADWCGPCHQLEEEVFPDSAVRKYFDQTVAVKIDVDHDRDLAVAYRAESLPTTVILSPEGSEVGRVTGSTAAADYADELGPIVLKAIPPAVRSK